MSTEENIIIKDEPPAKAIRQSRWSTIADTCRQSPGEWHRVAKPFTKKHMVLQVSSNIRSTHRRKKTIHGFNSNERWETSWAPSDKNDGTFLMWIRFVGHVDE